MVDSAKVMKYIFYYIYHLQMNNDAIGSHGVATGEIHPNPSLDRSLKTKNLFIIKETSTHIQNL
jgi:hypothetical protein